MVSLKVRSCGSTIWPILSRSGPGPSAQQMGDIGVMGSQSFPPTHQFTRVEGIEAGSGILPTSPHKLDCVIVHGQHHSVRLHHEPGMDMVSDALSGSR